LTDTLTLTGVALGDTADYDVVVTNAAGSATSAVAHLTVNPVLVAPGITTQPTPQAAPLGGSATFSVAASRHGSAGLPVGARAACRSPTAAIFLELTRLR
jgi:hypothetical protein